MCKRTLIPTGPLRQRLGNIVSEGKINARDCLKMPRFTVGFEVLIVMAMKSTSGV
jgi:hypothetical protein